MKTLLVAIGLGAVIAAGAAQAPDKAKVAADELEQGRQLLQRHEYFDALTRLKHANDLLGNRCAECLVAMAQAMQGMKVYTNVVDTAQSAIDATTDNPRLLARAYSLKGQALQALAEKDPAKYADAEAAFRGALAVDPESKVADLYFNLGVVLLRQHRDDDGVAALEREIEIRDVGTTADDARALIANPRRAREKYAPDFEMVSSTGERITLETLRGKVVLLDFWGAWCPPCVAAVPSLRKLQKQHVSDPFVIVSVSSDKDAHVWRAFTYKNGMTWPQYWDHTRDMQRGFDVDAFPTYVLLDGEGIERFRVSGTSFSEAKALSAAIDQQLKR